MSCIVGVVHDGEVWMGADSAASDGEDIMIIRNRKLFRNGPLLMGVVGSLRLTQLLQYQLGDIGIDAKWKNNLYGYMVGVFVERVREVLKAGGFPDTSESPENGGVVLIGVNGHIFRLENSFQIFERGDGFDAVGCGNGVALGSLMADHVLEPEDRILKAMARVTYFSAHVRPPFVIMHERGKYSADGDGKICG